MLSFLFYLLNLFSVSDLSLGLHVTSTQIMFVVRLIRLHFVDIIRDFTSSRDAAASLEPSRRARTADAREWEVYKSSLRCRSVPGRCPGTRSCVST